MRTQRYLPVQRCHASNTRSTCNCTSTCWRISRYPTLLSISAHPQKRSHDVYSRGDVRSRSLCPLPTLSLIHISEPTRLGMISYAVFCLKKKKTKKTAK